jgi:hypothetical protein
MSPGEEEEEEEEEKEGGKKASLHVRCLVLSRNFDKIWIFSTYFHTSPQISNLTETRCPVGAALIHTDGRKNITKLKGAFRDHANAPLKEYHCQAQTQDITLIHILLPAQIQDITCCQISHLVHRQMEASSTRNHPKRSIRLHFASTVL